MNSRITFCTLLLLLFSSINFAQPIFTITPNTTNPVNLGSTVTFNVTVENYTDIISVQFAISWDTNVLGFVSIDNPNGVDFPNLTNFNFGTSPLVINAGYFPLSWFEPTISPLTIPDGTRMFSFTMLAVGNGTTNVEIDPNRIQEIIDVNFDNIGLVAENTNVQVGGSAPINIPLVPTMTEWGLFLFSLLSLNLGLISIYRKNQIRIKAKGTHL